MTALLCIDTATNRVRRYAERRRGGMIIVTDEGQLVPSSPTLLKGIEQFREFGICAAADEPTPEAA